MDMIEIMGRAMAAAMEDEYGPIYERMAEAGWSAIRAPSSEMLAAALPIIDLNALSDEAKAAGAAVIMHHGKGLGVKPELVGEAVTQAAQLYADWQTMCDTALAGRPDQ